ncbi:MAG: 2-oxoacid:acceptor oxidoreductase family protein, partial [Vulcanisaeta sp.]
MTNMAGVTEFIFLGRGGQGGVTAARILVSAALKDGKWGQAIPEFGAERRGAVVKSYARIADKPVPLHSNVRRADVLVVLTSSVLDLVNVNELMKGNDSIIIVNSASPIKTGYRTYYVDATAISEKLGLVIAGWHI